MTVWLNNNDTTCSCCGWCGGGLISFDIVAVPIDVGLILIKESFWGIWPFDLIWFVGNNAGWYAYWKSLSVIMSSRTRKGCKLKRTANHHSGTLRLTFLLDTIQWGCFVKTETVLRIMSETKTKNGAKGILSYCNVITILGSQRFWWKDLVQSEYAHSGMTL